MRIGDRRDVRSLFMVGAPRCGTTSLSKALREHPEICVSRPKETFFFARPELRVPPERLAPEFIARYFQHLTDRHQVIAEATPVYLYVPEAIERILVADPDARFLVCVRNPIDLVHSHHARMVYTLDEDVKNFAEAWDLQEARSRGERLPSRCRDPRVLQYRFVGSLGARVEELFALVGRERCHVIVHDDLGEASKQVMRDLFEFLGVDPSVEAKLKRRRENFGYRHAWAQPFVMNPPAFIVSLVNWWERRGKGRVAYFRPIRKRLKRWNTRVEERSALDDVQRKILREAFAADVEKLGKLLDRDLSHWR